MREGPAKGVCGGEGGTDGTACGIGHGGICGGGDCGGSDDIVRAPRRIIDGDALAKGKLELDDGSTAADLFVGDDDGVVVLEIVCL